MNSASLTSIELSTSNDHRGISISNALLHVFLFFSLLLFENVYIFQTPPLPTVEMKSR